MRPRSSRVLSKSLAPMLAIISLSLLDPPGATGVFAQSSPRDSGRARPGGLGPRPPWTDSKVVGSPEPPAPYTVELAFPRLKFEFPVVLVPAAGTSRLFLGDLRGRIWSFPDDPACTRADLVVDVSRAHPDLSMFYGLIFHPDFEHNRYVYVCYALKSNVEDGSIVSRFEVGRTDPPTIDPKSEKVLLTFWSGGHNGGCLEFGKDGCLYISTGDGTDPSPPDGKQTGQDCSDLLSSVLRIDVDHEDAGKPYRVPPDNPFVGMPGVRPEIWAFGFRNPWKMSFDRATGDLWVGDVGWELWELVHRVERGGNYGWSLVEGPQPVQINGKRGPAPVSPPVIAHPHSEAASITGGYVYRGSRLPELAGAYVYGDYQTGTIWGLKYDGKTVTWRQELARTPLHLAAFGENRAGELYLVDHDRSHQVYRLIPNPSAGKREDFPRRLSQTGLFASTREHKPAPGVVPYAVNVELWADGATAERLLAIPGRGKASLDDKGNWKVPEGSVLARTVFVEAQAGEPTTRRRVETQVLHFEEDSWRPYSYVWTEDQSDAILADARGTNLTIPQLDPSAPGGRRVLDYRVHARVECVLCHNPWVEKKTTIFGRQSASPLSLNTLQLNRPHEYAGQSHDQLSAFHAMGLLDWTPDPGKLPHLTNPYDESAALEPRARSYLQVNCSHCHQFNAGGTATIALGFEVPLGEMRAIDARPLQGSFNIPDARIIAPGDPAGSVLSYRISKLGGGRMPRVGSNRVDVRATRLFRDWIAGMSPSKGQGADGLARARAEEQSPMETLRKGSSAPAEARVDAIRRLASTTHGALALLGQLDRGPVDRDLMREVVAITRASPQVEIRDLFERFIPDDERVKRLGDAVDRTALLALAGDPARGKAVFETSPSAQCKACHKIGPVGESVGPELSKIAAKFDRAALLEHILEPSKVIDPQYVSYLVETKDGQVLSGVIVERSDAAVVLKDAQAKTIRIPRDQVEQLAPQARSLMPELLLRDLTPQQAADLLHYLATLK